MKKKLFLYVPRCEEEKWQGAIFQLPGFCAHHFESERNDRKNMMKGSKPTRGHFLGQQNEGRDEAPSWTNHRETKS